MALTDEQIKKLATEFGVATEVVDAGYDKDLLWFDGDLTALFLAIESAATAPLMERIAALTAQVEHLKATASANYGRGHADAHSMQVEQAAQPVAHLWQHGETGRTRITMPDDITDCDARWQLVSPLYTSPPKAVPLTEPQILAAARAMNKLECDTCNVDEEDSWKLYGMSYIADATTILRAAHGITPATVEKGET